MNCRSPFVARIITGNASGSLVKMLADDVLRREP